jgi:hypothetical protein
MASTTKAQPPVHEIRMGKTKCCIWQNTSGDKTYHNVTVARLYKDGDDWKESTSFGRDDLPILAEVVQEAWKWIYTEARERRDRDAA